MTGAGVNENSWDPVVRALNKTSDTIINKNNAELCLTRHVYMMRIFKTLEEPDYSPYKDQHYDPTFIKTKQEISKHLIEAENSGEIKCRDFMKYIWIDLILPYSIKFHFYTTNWDRVAESYSLNLLKKISPCVTLPAFHIHGDVSDPSTLYLPSEEANEIYRTDDENQLLHNNIVYGYDMLLKTDHLIIYGLSLSALDAELAQGISCGLCGDSKVSKITIVDTAPTLVLERVKMLCNRNIQYEVINPLKYTPKHPPEAYKQILDNKMLGSDGK